MTPITALGSRYGIQGALGRSVKRAAAASAFVPTDISGCRLWLDFSDADYLFTDAGTTKVSTDGDAIYQANDKSGSGNHVAQGTADSRPLYKTGTNGINSKPIALFGGNDYLFRNEADWLSGDSAGSIFVVFSANTAQGMSFLTSCDTVSVHNWFNTDLYYVSGNPQYARILVRDGAPAPDILQGDTEISTTTTYLFTAKSSGTAYSMRINATDQSLTATSGANNGNWFGDVTLRDNLAVGALIRNSIASYMNGKIAEIIVYGSDLTGTDLSNVETYLNNKWAIYS